VGVFETHGQPLSIDLDHPHTGRPLSAVVYADG
jgi:hypothetical protein